MSNWEITSWIFLIVLTAFNIILTVVTTVGGVFDLKFLFKKLKEEVLDETDDGRVD